MLVEKVVRTEIDYIIKLSADDAANLKVLLDYIDCYKLPARSPAEKLYEQLRDLDWNKVPMSPCMRSGKG